MAGAVKHSVVIVSFNCLDELRACLESLPGGFGAPAAPPEIIVVDNASTDGTPELLAALPSGTGVRAVLSRENLGFSKGCNVGAAHATGEVVTFLNPDTRVSPGCAARMARWLAEPDVGAVGPLSNRVAGLQRIEGYLPEAVIAAIAGAGEPERVLERIADALGAARAGKAVETRFLIGFCLMMPRVLFQRIGGMDEALFLGNDDLDLSWRLRLGGYRLLVAADTFVYHAGQRSFVTQPPATTARWVQESTDALYRKLVRHYGGAERVPSAQALWGMDWFRPSPDLVSAEAARGAIPPEAQGPPPDGGADPGDGWLAAVEALSQRGDFAGALARLRRARLGRPLDEALLARIFSCRLRIEDAVAVVGDLKAHLDLYTPAALPELAVMLDRLRARFS